MNKGWRCLWVVCAVWGQSWVVKQIFYSWMWWMSKWISTHCLPNQKEYAFWKIADCFNRSQNEVVMHCFWSSTWNLKTCWKRLHVCWKSPCMDLESTANIVVAMTPHCVSKQFLSCQTGSWNHVHFCFALDWALGVHGPCVPNPVLFVGNRIEREKCSVKANWSAFWELGVMVVYPIFKLSRCKAHPHFQGRWNVLISRVSGWHFLAFPSCPLVNIWFHYWNSKELKWCIGF